MSKNFARKIDDIVYTKATKLAERIEKYAAEKLRLSQEEARKALKRSQKENAEMLIQTHEKYLTFSVDLQKKTQLTLDKLQKMTPTLADNHIIQAISKELQSTLDSAKAKDREFRAWEAFEATQLIVLQQTKAFELNALHESKAKKLSVLQKIDLNN